MKKVESKAFGRADEYPLQRKHDCDHDESAVRVPAGILPEEAWAYVLVIAGEETPPRYYYHQYPIPSERLRRISK